jgi:hypothetical protein
VDFDPPPSASGDVAPELFLEGPSRGDDLDSRYESDSRHESESRHEVEDEDEDEDEGDARPKKLRTRGESCIPDERKEPKTQEAKTLIIPDGVR